MATGYEDLIPTKQAAPTGYEDLIPASEIPGPRIQPPAWAAEFPRLYRTAVTTRRGIGPALEMLGGAGGAVVGAAAGLPTIPATGPVGPIAGGVAGAALGYGGVKQGLRTVDVGLGLAPPATLGGAAIQAATDVAEGATYEMGGRLIAPYIAKPLGWLADMGNAAYTRAGNFARQTLGTDVAQTVNALRSAPPGVGVAEATAGIQSPAWQAFVRDSLEKTPEGAAYLNRLATMTDQQAVNELNMLAKGATETSRRTARALEKETLTDITSPARQAALERANQGKRVLDFEAEAAALRGQASQKVEDVRRLTAAGEKAEAASHRVYTVPFLPRVPGRYTYPGELAKQADEWASQAATGSLDLGQGSRFAQSAAESLRKAGIAPLKTDDIVRNISTILRDPKSGIPGNDVLDKALRNVAEDLTKWTNSAGVIDAQALESIRKNSVNAAIRQLNPTMDATAQKRLAAGVLSRVNPMIDEAIEGAGGVGWKSYLDDYAAGMRKINETKLVGEAARLWKQDKNAFVKLVQGESPEVVEKILGPKNYDIAKELSDDVMKTLTNQANRHLARVAASEQASEGTKALATLIQQNSKGIKVPNPLNFYVAVTNRTLDTLENRIGKKSMQVLSRAMQSPQTAADLLATLPASERSRVLRLINSPELWSAASFAVAGARGQLQDNALAPTEAPANALAR